MPSIAEATGGDPDYASWKLAIGFGMVLLGGLFVGLGVGGLSSGSSVRTATLAGGLFVLLALFVVATQVPLGERERTFVVTGSSIGFASALLFWALAPPVGPASAEPGIVVTSFGFLIGLAIELAAVLAGITAHSGYGNRSELKAVVEWDRSLTGTGENKTSADGGHDRENFSSHSNFDR